MIEPSKTNETNSFKLYLDYLKNGVQIIVHKFETDFYTLVNIKSLSFNEFNKIYSGQFSFSINHIFYKCDLFGDKCYLSFKDFRNKYL